MPIIKSAKKRVRQAHKASARNVRTKRAVKTSVKDLNKKSNEDTFKKAQSTIDIAVKKGVLHKNKAARKKSQLAAEAKAAGVKLSGKKSTTKKTGSSKKPVAKKASPKKTTAKKPASKK